MSAIQSLLQAHPENALALGGFLIGLAFGGAAQRGNFCVMGALSDWRTSGSSGRLGAVACAAAVAIAGAQTLHALALTDLSKSMYLAPAINWAGAIGGGLLFGAGMVYAGGCASRNLVRAGGGDMRSLLVLAITGISAYATMSGVIAPIRAEIEHATSFAAVPSNDAVTSAGLPGLLAHAGLPAQIACAAASVLLIVPLLAFAARSAKSSGLGNLMTGAVIGLAVSAGWLITGLSHDEMALHPVAPSSLSFVRPVGDAIDWLERATALGLPGFGAASVFGVLAGAALAAGLSGRWRLLAFSDANDMARHITGALAMGIGGVFALGCSIGQGITGLSTLSLQSLLAAASIVVGALLALAKLERGL